MIREMPPGHTGWPDPAHMEGEDGTRDSVSARDAWPNTWTVFGWALRDLADVRERAGCIAAEPVKGLGAKRCGTSPP
jgi:hypothetical protein